MKTRWSSILILALVSAFPMTAQMMDRIQAGFRVAGTMAVGDNPLDLGTDAELFAGYRTGLSFLSAVMSVGVGSVGTTTRTELYEPRYNMLVVPLGLGARFVTPSDTGLYGLAEVRGGMAFLQVIYRGDQDLAKEPDHYTTSWSAASIGGGYGVRPGIAAEVLAGVRAIFFQERILPQVRVEIGLTVLPARLAPTH